MQLHHRERKGTNQRRCSVQGIRQNKANETSIHTGRYKSSHCQNGHCENDQSSNELEAHCKPSVDWDTRQVTNLIPVDSILVVLSENHLLAECMDGWEPGQWLGKPCKYGRSRYCIKTFEFSGSRKIISNMSQNELIQRWERIHFITLR